MRKALLLLALAAGCADAPDARKTSATRDPGAVPAFPPPGGPAPRSEPLVAVRSLPRPDPLLLPGDVLTISVFRQPDLALPEIRIPQGGRTPSPRAGPGDPPGHPQAELESTIRTRLEKDFLREASVTVTVK